MYNSIWKMTTFALLFASVTLYLMCYQNNKELKESMSNFEELKNISYDLFQECQKTAMINSYLFELSDKCQKENAKMCRCGDL